MPVVYALSRVSEATVRYVGVTSRTAEARFVEHSVSARQGVKRPVYDWMRKYDDVTFNVLHETDSMDEAFSLEMLEIASRPNLLNLTEGGEGVVGLVFSDAAREKISQTHKGRKFSDEHRSKIAAATKARYASRTITLSFEHRSKIGKAMKGRIISDETKLRMSQARKLYWERKHQMEETQSDAGC